MECARARYLCAFFPGRRLRIQHMVLLVALDEPLIRRMRFANINDEEGHLVTKALIQGFEVPSLGTKRGSGKAPKDEGNRFMVMER